MAKIIVSIAGAKVKNIVGKKKPSKLIPFNGQFPLVESYRMDDFNEEIRNKQYLDDCSDWVQDAIVKGLHIVETENTFKKFLEDNNISVELSLSTTNPHKLLLSSLNFECPTIEYLSILLCLSFHKKT